MLLTQVKNSEEIIFENRVKLILTRILLLSIISFWIYGFLHPAISLTYDPLSNFFLSKVYSTVCHQESVKCISIYDSSMLVCARCAGIYSGALLAGLLSLIMIIPLISGRVLVLSSIPLASDVFLTFTGVYNYSQGFAFATGLVFGCIAYLISISKLEELFSNKSFMGNE